MPTKDRSEREVVDEGTREKIKEEELKVWKDLSSFNSTSSNTLQV